MISPSITDLTKNEFNRYTLSIATAKCARALTNEYVEQKEAAERAATGNKDRFTILSLTYESAV